MKNTKKINKKTPMLLSDAARLLAEEHPNIAFSAEQLRRLARKKIIPTLEMPACGVLRPSYHYVCYTELVAFLKRCYKPSIYLPENV